MEQKRYIPFTQEMKKDYTILVPNMLPMHFELIMSVMRTYGYKMELLRTSGPEIVGRRGCGTYITTPATLPVLVIGQFMDALTSGQAMTRIRSRSSYSRPAAAAGLPITYPLLRKALERARLWRRPGHLLQPGGAGEAPGLHGSTLSDATTGCSYGVLYADLLMALANQCKPYEREKGQAQRLAERLDSPPGPGARLRQQDPLPPASGRITAES